MKIQAINCPVRNFLRFNQVPKRYLFLNQGFDTFTFSGKKSKEEIKQEQQKIKKILLKVKKEKGNISLNKLSELMGFKTSIIQHYIKSDEKLKILWESVKKYERFIFSNEEKEEFIKAVGDFLCKAEKNSQKISMEYIAEKIGISGNSVKRIIENNPQYKELYEKVRKFETPKYRTYDEITEEERLIKEALEDAKQTGTTSLEKLSEQTGIDIGTVRRRIENNPYLNELYNSLKVKRHTQKEMLQIRQKIIDILNIKIQNNEQVTFIEIEQYCGMGRKPISKMIKNDEELNNLWQKTQHVNITKFSYQDAEKLDNFIHRFLTQQREQHKTITLDEIAQHFNLPKNVIVYRIRSNPSLKYQWDKVKSKEQRRFDNWEEKSQKEELAEILRGYKSKGTNVTLRELATMTGVSRKTVKIRILESATLKKLWQEAGNAKTTYSKSELKKQNADIKKLISDALAKNEKITLNKISEIIGIPQGTVVNRLRSNKQLQDLWQKAHEKQND